MKFDSLFHNISIWRKMYGKNHKEIKDNEFTEQLLTNQLTLNLAAINQEFGSSPDMIIRQFKIDSKREAAIVFVDGLVRQERVEETILRPLLNNVQKPERNLPQGDLIEYIQSILPNGKIGKQSTLNQVISGVLSGDTALLINDEKEALLINTRGGETRPITEPIREITLKGSREGFVESLWTNISILRRKVRSPKLNFEIITLGQRTRLDVCIAYLKGVTGDSLIDEIRSRLKRINTDAILDSGQLEEFVKDSPLSPFSTIAYSERPDVATAKILEGRAAILIDGTPVVLTVPMLFMERFQNPDDYNFNYYYATLIRWIRFTAYLLTVFSPALYVALISYHPELIPTPLLITMAAAAEGTPFPAVVEALGMGVTVEILREAGRWMSGAGGPIVTVLGLLVVGQALVTSGLVGAPFVIVIAITLVTSFLVPTQEDVNPILRLFFVFLSGFLGLYGLMLGFIIVYIHLVFLRSFGVPYLSPITPWNLYDMKDVLIRAPWWIMRDRPVLISREDRVRQGDSLKPTPPEKE